MLIFSVTSWSEITLSKSESQNENITLFYPSVIPAEHN